MKNELNTGLVSIIIPVKNGSNYLQEALDGIKKQEMNVEIIVVDDASTDNTFEIASNFGCKVLKHEDTKGQIAAKNTGIKSSLGEYIMFHDHDDVMREGSLLKLCKHMSENPQTSMVMAKVKDFISPEITNTNVRPNPEPYWGLFTGAVLIRKSVFDEIGLFDENYNTGEIIALKSKMDAKRLIIDKLDFVSSDRRIHNTNYGQTNRKKEMQDYAAILRAKMAANKQK